APIRRPDFRARAERRAARGSPLGGWRARAALLAALLSAAPAAGQTRAAPPAPDRQLSHQIYRELLEIDTTQSSGDTARAAQAMAQRLLDAGFPKADVQVFTTAPKRRSEE